MKTEVRRGRKFVEYIDDSLPAGTFVQEIGAHDVSYQDEGGLWHQLVEDWEVDGQDGFSFRASRMNHKVRFDSLGAWRWYPRRNVETEYIVINRPQCWLTATKRWGNLLVNGISREGRDITLTSVRKVTRVIHSGWNGIKTDWILLDNTAPTKFRQKIDLVGLTELDGWLYGADGERLAQLTPTTAIDANEVELPCSGVYEGGYLQFEADVSGAAYPVTIDPDFSTTSSGGDTFIRSGVINNYGTADSIQLVPDARKGLLRFPLDSISSSATCSAATLQLSVTQGAGITLSLYKIMDANGNWAETTCNWDYKVIATSTAWAGSAGLSTAGTDFVNTNLVSSSFSSPNYTLTFNASGLAVLQDWFGDASNNGLLLLGSATTYYIASKEHATESLRPKLTVTYTTGSTGVPKHFLHYARLRSN